MKKKFENCRDNLSLTQLNDAYGDKGRTFEDLNDAILYERGLEGGGYITKLVNYNQRQVEYIKGTAKPLAGVIPYIMGYLVTPKKVNKC